MQELQQALADNEKIALGTEAKVRAARADIEQAQTDLKAIADAKVEKCSSVSQPALNSPGMTGSVLVNLP